MRFLEKAHDGNEKSGVTGYYLIEIKPLFSIVLLKFTQGSREVFHNHAFNAVTLWLKGEVFEYMKDGSINYWKAGNIKYTPRTTFHNIFPTTEAWVLSFRGPWIDRWKELKLGKYTTLTHGRIEVKD